MNPKVKHISIDSEREGQRLDNFLLNYFKNVPKSRIYKAVRKGEVRVNKKRVNVKYRIQAGDDIRIPPIRMAEKEDVAIKLNKEQLAQWQQTILYEDDDLLIINKPSGIPVHGGTGLSHGVINIWRALKPNLKYLELAHRLDKETSGCLILVKNRQALQQIHELMRERNIEKKYRALVMGKWDKTKTKVDLPLHKNQLSSGERIVKVSDEGKPAVTHFSVEQYFDAATLVTAKLDTGRTHQIRVHCAASGHPIASDNKYGDKAFNRYIKEHGCNRLFLHAQSLEFLLEDKKISVSAELPEELQQVLQIIMAFH